MTRLRAATLSNKLVKVRQKRKGDEVFDLTNEPVKAKRKTKKPDLNRTDSIASNNSHGSGVVPCDVPWPDHFKRLGTLHRSLNTIYVFCCTRKHVITTFDTLKSSVEAQIKRPLQVSDVAQLKYLLPSVINFSYVSEAALQVNILEQGGGSKPDVYDPSFSKESVNRHALYLEYVDGELKHKITKTQFGFRRAINDELKVLEYTPAAMAKLIAKRNKKFDNAVNAFLSACRENAVDPEMKITDESQSFIPETPKVEEDTLQTTAGQIPTEIPKVRASIEEIVDDLQKDEHYSCQIVPNGRRILQAQPARYGELSKQLSQDMVNALYNSKNISQFFTHQADAINNLWEGHNVIVATSTSSGKSLIYQLPVLCALEEDAASRAMYIFPTKALAQDQKRSLIDLMSYMPGLQDVLVDTYDGDTPMDERTRIRDQASIIFTNPDMLHVNLLPKEEYWRTFLKHLKFVVVDELHVYNGLFGAHVAFVMRRLRRLCHTLGNRHVQFISCSATIANPVEHMCTVFGLKDVKLIEEDGSPAGKKEFLCWNCPYKDVDDSSSGKVDACTESARLLVNLILRGVRTIAFCKVRRMCEAVLQAVHRQLQYVDRPDVKSRVMSYRGGYTPQDRRRIEKEMFEGQLLGIIATNALELGVDIGSLDAVVIVGFPYSIANLRQQSGRAGRRNKDSLAILVGEAYPIDQHLMNKPDELFTKPNNSLQLDLSNPLVLEGHLQCAAFEMPIRVEEDKHFFGAELASLAHDRLQADLQGFFHCHPRFRPYPSKFVAMRDVEEEHFPIVDITNGRNHVLEELEASRAFFTIYEGAIFMHQGSTYLVREFNPDKKMAKVERANVEWTTRQRDYTDVDPIETQAIRHLEGSPCRVYYGNIRGKLFADIADWQSQWSSLAFSSLIRIGAFLMLSK